METFLFPADINQPDRYNATAWDYARNRQLHYCQLIIMSHQRQRMMSNPTSPLPNGLGLLMHAENGVQEDFSRMVRKTILCLACGTMAVPSGSTSFDSCRVTLRDQS